MRGARIVTVTSMALVAACQAPPTASEHRRGCLTADPAAFDQFVHCDVGSGSFGSWVRDHGLPAFDYELDHEGAAISRWVTSGEVERTDHLFQLGNDRVIAIASNQGLVQLFHREGVPELLNRVDLDAGHSGGGYSVVAEDGDAWASAYALRPAGARVRRIYGSSHSYQETVHRGLRIGHEIVAPPGDATFLVDDVTIENLGRVPRTIRHYEIWDVARHSLELQLLRSGTLRPDLPAIGDGERAAINAEFTQVVAADGSAMRVSHQYRGDDAVPADQPANRDYRPADIFLARLLPATDQLPLAMHSRRAAFYGDGSLSAPAAAVSGTPPDATTWADSAAEQPASFADRIDLTLDPGASVRLRYAYGYVDQGAELPAALAELTDPARSPAAEAAAALSRRLPYFVAERFPELHREAAWHAGQLQAATVYDGYLGSHLVVQGSAYMYGHGLDGAARDYALFTIPLVYLRPDLARELLRTIMRMTYADSQQISYAIAGRGQLEDATIHTAPSDLDLFFLWALTEYVAATGDRGFLDETVAFWPRDAGSASVAEHARLAYRHLAVQVGLGPRGLIRLGTGDWSDGVVQEADDGAEAVQYGESIPNSQMAAWVLPRTAALLGDYAPADADEMRALVAELLPRIDDEWIGSWYRRAWLGRDQTFGDGHLNLESQIWGLIGELPAADRRDQLIAAIDDRLETPVGARRVPGGMIWHAITGLLSWGYALHAPELAWRALGRHSLSAYAERNPDQWYGTWSGPDGIGVDGGTWASIVTPITDWPVMNANAHAMPLIGLLRVAGIAPAAAGGLRIAPTPGEAFVLDLPLLHLDAGDGYLELSYRAQVDGQTRLELAIPPGDGAVELTVDGTATTVADDQPVVIDLDFEAGRVYQISMRRN